MIYFLDSDEFLIEELEREIEFLEYQLMDEDQPEPKRKNFLVRLLKRLGELLGIIRKKKVIAQQEEKPEEVARLKEKEATIIRKQKTAKKKLTLLQRLRSAIAPTKNQRLAKELKKKKKEKRENMFAELKKYKQKKQSPAFSSSAAKKLANVKIPKLI